MANGLFGGGDGSVNNPYFVEDAQDLNSVRNYSGKYFRQVTDIDLSSYANWLPITSDNHYNGNGYKIINLKINRPTENYIGLFSSYGNLSYINLVNCDVTGNMYVGGLVGMYQKSNGTIHNCQVSGHVKGYAHVGLLVGNHENGRIDKCLTEGEVTANSSAGGLLGRNQSSSGGISNSVCLASKINRLNGSYDTYFGDIVGEKSGTITNCYSIETLQFVQL